MDNNTLSHSVSCKYHIVFAPKFRRKVIYKQIRANVGHDLIVGYIKIGVKFVTGKQFML